MFEWEKEPARPRPRDTAAVNINNNPNHELNPNSKLNPYPYTLVTSHGSFCHISSIGIGICHWTLSLAESEVALHYLGFFF